MKKKLLIFDSALAPYRIDLFNGLNEAFETNIYFFRKNPGYDTFDLDKLVSQLNFKPRFLTSGFEHPSKDRMIRFGFIDKIIEHKPDLIICLEFSLMTFFTVVFSRLVYPRTKVYSLCDDSVEVAVTSSVPRKISRYLSLKLLHGLILSNEPAQTWYNTNFPKVKTVVTPIIQKEERISHILRNARPLSENYMKKYNLLDKNVLLYVGRLVEVKNLKFLLEVFALYLPANNNAVLVLVGDGDKKNELLEHVSRLGIQEHVIFAGRYEHDALYAWYPVADYFILPSTWEPFGAVVNESLIAGVPVLCSAVAGAACLITEKNGQTISPYDKEALLSVFNNVLGKKRLSGRGYSITDSLMPYTFNQRLKELVIFLMN